MGAESVPETEKFHALTQLPAREHFTEFCCC